MTGIGGLPLEQIAPDGSVHFYHQDQLGSTRAITNTADNLETVYAYDPYGQVASVNMGGAVNNPFQYAGQYTDAESRLQYLRARFYEPATGQFLTRDPAVVITRQTATVTITRSM